MSPLYVLVIVIVGGCLFHVLRIVSLITKSKRLVKEAKPFEHMGKSTVLPFLFAGDSTAVGVGSSNSKETVAGYFSQDFPHRPIKNLSKSGRKTEELISLLRAQPSNSAEWVFLQTGGNDILYFTSRNTLKLQIAEVLQESKRIGNHVVLLTSGNIGTAPFFPFFIRGIWTMRTLWIRTLFTAAAKKEGVLYVDLFQSRKDDIFLTDIARFYSADLLHPSGAGYKEWYNKIRKTIKHSGLESKLS